MNLNDAEVEAAFYAISDFLRYRRRAERFIPLPVLQIQARMHAHVTMSSPRHETGCKPVDLESSSVWIGARAAASILGKNIKWVQRHYEEIGGHKNGGRLFFPEASVIDYYVERISKCSN